MTIGERATQEILKRVKINGGFVKDELRSMSISHDVYSKWKYHNLNPSAYFLQQMALHGYDIYYILTGERST